MFDGTNGEWWQVELRATAPATDKDEVLKW
jgi:hypothetical protein